MVYPYRTWGQLAVGAEGLGTRSCLCCFPRLRSSVGAISGWTCRSRNATAILGYDLKRYGNTMVQGVEKKEIVPSSTMAASTLKWCCFAMHSAVVFTRQDISVRLLVFAVCMGPWCVFHVPHVRLTSGQASAVKMPARDVVPNSTVLERRTWAWHAVQGRPVRHAL